MAQLRARRAYVWLGAAILVGLFTRFWNLTLHSLYIDEAFSLIVGRLPVRDIPQFVAHNDFHPPVFYIVTHYLETWLRWPAWDYRVFIAVFGIITIIATWAITRRVFGDTAAGIAALVAALEPGLVQYDRLYRMYAVLVALSALSWWLLLVAENTAGRRRIAAWLGYATTAVVLPYVHYLGALTLIAQGIYALAGFRRRWPTLVCDGAAVLALMPWLWAVRLQYPRGGLVVQLSGGTFSFFGAIRYLLGEGMPIGWLHLPHFDLIFTLAACAVVAAAIWLARRTMLPFWFLPPLLQIIASFTLHKDLAIPRYLYPAVPAFAAAVGVVSSALWRTRARVAGLALTLTVLTLGFIEVENVLFVPYYQFPDWYAVSVLLAQRERKDDVIVIVQGSPYWVVRRLRGFRRHQILRPTNPADVKPTIAWIDTHPKQRIWYIENQEYFTDHAHKIQKHLQHRRRLLSNWLERRASLDDMVYIALYGPVALPGRTKSVVKTKSP